MSGTKMDIFEPTPSKNSQYARSKSKEQGFQICKRLFSSSDVSDSKSQLL